LVDNSRWNFSDGRESVIKDISKFVVHLPHLPLTASGAARGGHLVEKAIFCNLVLFKSAACEKYRLAATQIRLSSRMAIWIKEKKLIISEKTVYTVGYLRQVSWHALEEAKEKEKSSYLNLMTSLVFSAFTIEAYLNYLGEKIIPFWSTIERNLSPAKKLEAIAIQLAQPIDFGRRPFQSFNSIFQVRDLLAHARTEYMKDESIQVLSENGTPKLPQAKWQEQITIENVQRYLDDTKEMIEHLHHASRLDSIRSIRLKLLDGENHQFWKKIKASKLLPPNTAST